MNPASVPTLSPIPFAPVDLSTKATVTILMSKCDGRSSCTEADLSGVICAVLGLRGLGHFKFDKSNKTKGQKAAIDQVLRHLHSDLIVGVKGKDLYEVTKSIKLKATKVRPDTPNEFAFRVTSEHVNYPSSVAIPCAEAVTLIGGNRACKLVLPQVAMTFQMLLNGQSFPTRINKLEPLDNITGGKDFTKEYRKVVDQALYRAGYLGCLIDDGSDEALTFAVVTQYANDFPTWLQTATRPWFREWKFDLVRFYAEVEDHRGNKGTITGSPTMQILRQQAGINGAA